jgi:aromatic-amino-acid transaminase
MLLPRLSSRGALHPAEAISRQFLSPRRCPPLTGTGLGASGIWTRMRGVHRFLIHGDRPGDDPIFSLNQEATARQARGEKIINATIGVLLKDDGSLAVLPTAARTVAEVGFEAWAAYAPIAGSPDFLEATVDDILGAHPALKSGAIAVATPGGTGGVRHAICTFLDRDQALLTSSFYWGPYGTIADEHGRRVVTFDMFDPRGPADQLNVAALDEKLGALIAEQGRALVIFNDPCHNPTGYSMNERDWRDVAAIIGRHAERGPVTVLIDAAYAAYAPQGIGLGLAALETIADRVLLLIAWSASKTFTHYGLRVGSLIAVVPDAAEQKQVQAALGYACRATWSNCNRGGMLAITRLLREGGLKVDVARERDAAVAELSARVRVFNEAARPAGLRYPRYDGGFFVTVFTEDPKPAAERMRADGVFVVPFQRALRLALCAVAAGDVPRLVERTAAALAGA